MCLSGGYQSLFASWLENKPAVRLSSIGMFQSGLSWLVAQELAWSPFISLCLSSPLCLSLHCMVMITHTSPSIYLFSSSTSHPFFLQVSLFSYDTVSSWGPSLFVRQREDAVVLCSRGSSMPESCRVHVFIN